MLKRRFHATATNAAGATFQFSFLAFNWGGIETIARQKLNELIAANKLHQKHGPWSISGIDVG